MLLNDLDRSRESFYAGMYENTAGRMTNKLLGSNVVGIFLAFINHLLSKSLSFKKFANAVQQNQMDDREDDSST